MTFDDIKPGMITREGNWMYEDYYYILSNDGEHLSIVSIEFSKNGNENVVKASSFLSAKGNFDDDQLTSIPDRLATKADLFSRIFK